MSDTLESLCTQWLNAKSAEQSANAQRVAIEMKIVELTGKRDEGAKTVEADGFKVKVTGKVTRKMDWPAWDSIKSQIPAEMHPVKTKQELDETGVKWLATHKPDFYKLLPISVTPGKASVEVILSPTPTTN